MNLTNFLKQTDTIIAQCSKEQLTYFIHDIGRVLPEHDREDFLKKLEAVSAITDKEPAKDTKDQIELNKMYKLIQKNLKIIDSQEATVEGILNEEYDDWYNNSSEEFYYQDNDGISDMLANACDFVHACTDRGKYQKGYEIGNQLFCLNILCTSEYGDKEFSIRDMVYHELLDRDLMQVCLDTAYCAYHAVPSKKRPEALYEVIVNAKEDKITLETIMQHGDEELSDFQDFLTLLTAYLGEKTGRDADRLILEASSLLADAFAPAQCAEKYVAFHPGLYLAILENEKYANIDDMIALGIKAMQVMPKKYIMRSRIALKTAEYIIKANKNLSELEKCYYIAYESDTSATNYLRALLTGSETERKKEELQKVFVALSKQNSNRNSYDGHVSNSIYSERKENKPDDNMIFFLRFLDGQFASVLEKGLNEPEALDWSTTFIKQGIALYLLYLYEGPWTEKGITAMADIVKNTMDFSAKAYQKGMDGMDTADENKLFSELFLKWKSMVQMEPDTKTRAMKKITRLLEKRTAEIMDANARYYYGECAAYIAALGEVRESLGEMNAKQKLMTSYKDAYFRRNLFRKEMRGYGWIDTKK